MTKHPFPFPFARLAVLLAAVILIGSACGSDSRPSSGDAAVAETDTLDPTPTASTDGDGSTGQEDDAPIDEPQASDAVPATPTPAAVEEPASDWPEPPAIWEDFRRSRLAGLGHFEGDIESEIGAPLPQRLEAGTHVTGSLGVELTFETTRPRALIEENPGHILLVEQPGSRGTLYFLRPVGVFTGEASLDANAQVQGRGISNPLPEDARDWLAAIPEVAVSAGESAEVGGLAATRFEISLAKDRGYFCQVGTCINLLPSGAAMQSTVLVHGGQAARLWEVELPGADLIILAKASEDDPTGWLDAAQAIVDSVVLGDAENAAETSSVIWDPRGQVTSGQHRWAGVDWISTTFEQPVGFINFNGVVGFRPLESEMRVSLARVATTMDGAPVADLDDFTRVMEDAVGQENMASIAPIDVPNLADGEVRSWLIVDEAAGEVGKPLFHYAALPDGEPSPGSAVAEPSHYEIHAFVRDGQVWTAIFTALSEAAQEDLNAAGAAILAAMDFDRPATAGAVTPLPSAGDVVAGAWTPGFDPTIAIELADEDLAVAVNSNGIALLQDREMLAQGLPLRWLALARPAGYASEAELVELPSPGGYSGDPAQLADWIAAVTSPTAPVAVVEERAGTIAGHPARILDLTVTDDRTDSIPGGCGQERCYGFMTTGAITDPIVVRPGERYRIWFVADLNLLIIAAADANDGAWLDQSEALVDTIALAPTS